MQERNQTLIQRLGFSDPDRRTPIHDQIQIWAFSHVDVIIRDLFPTKYDFEITYKRLEHPIPVSPGNGKTVVGFIDLFVDGYLLIGSERSKRFVIAIEIKSKIASCGDLIRQLNFYRQFMPDTEWMVISPDARYE
jgi:hypothetical protein